MVLRRTRGKQHGKTRQEEAKKGRTRKTDTTNGVKPALCSFQGEPLDSLRMLRAHFEQKNGVYPFEATSEASTSKTTLGVPPVGQFRGVPLLVCCTGWNTGHLRTSAN